MSGAPTPNRREWRVLSLLAPSLNLDPWAGEQPFSVKPDKKVNVRQVMAIHRDVYEGTPFEQTGSPLARSVRHAQPLGAAARLQAGRRLLADGTDDRRAPGVLRHRPAGACEHARVARQRCLVRARRREDVGVLAALRGQLQGAGGVRSRAPRQVRPQLGVLGVELRRQLVEPQLPEHDPGHPREAAGCRGQAVRRPDGRREDGARDRRHRPGSRPHVHQRLLEPGGAGELHEVVGAGRQARHRLPGRRLPDDIRQALGTRPSGWRSRARSARSRLRPPRRLPHR